MLAAYSTRRTSVVLNPRGRVLGGLGAEEGEGTGAESYRGDIYGGGDTQALADADAIKAQIDLEASSKQAYEALAAAKQQADKSAANIKGLISMIPVVGTVVKAFEFVGNFLANEATARSQPGYAARQAEASKAMAEAQALAAGAGGDTRVLAEVSKVQNALAKVTVANNAYTQAQINEAIRVSKQTFSDADVITGLMRRGMSQADAMAALNRFYAFSSTTTAAPAGAGGGLALPIIAAVAGFLIFGG